MAHTPDDFDRDQRCHRIGEKTATDGRAEIPKGANHIRLVVDAGNRCNCRGLFRGYQGTAAMVLACGWRCDWPCQQFPLSRDGAAIFQVCRMEVSGTGQAQGGTMIENIKTGLVVVLALACWYLNYAFENYKENINDQLQANVVEKARIEAIHNEQYTAVERDLVVNRGRLDDALKRLRDAENLPGESGVQVAGCSSDSVLGANEGAARTVADLKTYPGTASIDFYADAMIDNLQCQTLIDYLNDANIMPRQ